MGDFLDKTGGLGQNSAHMQKRIVLAVIEAGGGHKAPAQAVRESLERLYPGRYDVALMDFMKDLGCTGVDRRHKASWNFMLAHPGITRYSYRAMVWLGPLARFWVRLAILPFYLCAYRYLKTHCPSVIYSTHYLNSYAIGDLKKWFGFPVTLVTQVTEPFDIHPLWVIKNSDRFVVSSEANRRYLLVHGVRKERILVAPFAVRREFTRIVRRRDEICSELGIDPDRRTLLVSFGGQGIGGIDRYVDALENAEVSLNMIAVTGRNEDQRRVLLRKQGGLRYVNLIVRGYVTNLNELIFVSDVCFVKPGPATVMEVVSLQKPLLLYECASLHERGNVDYCTSHGIGWHVGRSVEAFVRRLRRLLGDTELQRVRDNYRRMEVSNGADDIARYLAACAAPQ